MDGPPSDVLSGDPWTPTKQVCPLVGRGVFPLPVTGGQLHVDPSGVASLAHVRGILFEPANIFYDDTLWRRWLLKVLSKMGLHTHYHVFFSVWQNDYVPQVHRGEKSFATVLREFLAASGFVSRQIDELIAATKAQRLKFEAEHRLLPGVARGLAALKRNGMKLAVSTDSAFTAAEIGAKLNRMGLEGLFSGIVSSRDLGMSKPQAECYHAAAELLGLPSAEIALVSYHPVHLEGARLQGMTPIAHHCSGADEAMVAIERFDELLVLFPTEFAKRLAG